MTRSVSMLAAALVGCTAMPDLAVQVPEEVDWVALMVLNQEGQPVRASGLIPWHPDASLPVFTEAESEVVLVGFSSEQMESLAESVNRDFEAIDKNVPLEAAEECDRMLPDPIWFVRWDSDNTIRAPERAAPSLTTPWLPSDGCASPCVSFDVQRVRLPDWPPNVDGRVTVASPLSDPDTVFVATADGRYYRVRKSGEATQLTNLNHGPRGASFARGDDLWLFGAGRTHAHINLDEGIYSAHTSTSSEKGHGWLEVGGALHGDFEAFVISGDNRFERFDGTTWSVIYDRPDDDDGQEKVVRTGPQEAWASGIAGQTIVHYKDGVVTEEALDIFEAPIAIGYAESLGVVVGQIGGRLSIRGEDGWRSISSPEETLMRQILPLDDGILFGGVNGRFHQYYEGYGFCSETLFPSETAYRATATPYGFVMASRFSVYFLSRKRD